MGHRHVSHKSPVFEVDQDQNHNHFPAEQPYNHMGRIVPGTSSSIHPVAVMPRGLPYASQWDSESRQNHHSSSSISMEVPHAHAAVLGSSYDPFPCMHAPGGSYLASENSAHHAHSNYYNRQGGVIDPTTGKGTHKRKSTGVSVACERGSTSRYLSVGSSSSSSQQLEKPTLNHHIYPPAAIGLPHNMGSSPSIATEDSLRNVRSRPTLDVEPNPRGSNLSSYFSHHYHSATELMNNPGTLDLSHMNADIVTHDRNGIYVSPAPHGRFQTSEANGFSHETNQFLYGGSTAEIGGYQQHESNSRRNPVSSQYLHAPSAQSSREGRTNYSRRVIPTYRAGLSYPHLGHEAAASENGLQFLSETYSSRNSRPLSSGEWHHNYRNGRSRMAVERFESLPSMVDVQERMGSEALLMLDRSSSNDSRNLFDQYREMRLDTDNMTYEDLLALGESIGNVSTGVSECMLSKCLMETAYCSSDENQGGANCAICLEEYSNKDEVGTVKNCGHSYHVACVKKWLSMKNACPICKGPALSDSLDEG